MTALGGGLGQSIGGTTGPALVERSSVSGSVNETRVLQANWNIDKPEVKNFNPVQETRIVEIKETR